MEQEFWQDIHEENYYNEIDEKSYLRIAVKAVNIKMLKNALEVPIITSNAFFD